jgi:hypothetical protein
LVVKTPPLLVPQKVDELVVMSEIKLVLAFPTMMTKVPSAWKFVVHPIGTEVGTALGQGVSDGTGVGVGLAGPVNVGKGEEGGPLQSWIDWRNPPGGAEVKIGELLELLPPQLSIKTAQTKTATGANTNQPRRGNIGIQL